MNGDITDERMVFKRGIELIYQPIEQDMEAFGRSLEAFIKLSLGRTECKVDVSPKPSSNIKFGNGIEACSEPKCSGVECPITPQSTRLNLKDVVEEAAPVVKIRLSDFLPGNRLCKLGIVANFVVPRRLIRKVMTSGMIINHVFSVFVHRS